MNTQDTRPTIAPQAGKRYVTRTNAITGLLRYSSNGPYRWTDGRESWMASALGDMPLPEPDGRP